MKKRASPKRWTQEECEILAKAVAEQGKDRSWPRIATLLPGRTAKQCRFRWKNQSTEETKQGEWEPEEEMVIATEHVERGSCWARISRLLQGRTENAIKNHWNSYARSRTIQRPRSLLWHYVKHLTDDVVSARQAALTAALDAWQLFVPATHSPAAHAVYRTWQQEVQEGVRQLVDAPTRRPGPSAKQGSSKRPPQSGDADGGSGKHAAGVDGDEGDDDTSTLDDSDEDDEQEYSSDHHPDHHHQDHHQDEQEQQEQIDLMHDHHRQLHQHQHLQQQTDEHQQQQQGVAGTGGAHGTQHELHVSNPLKRKSGGTQQVMAPPDAAQVTTKRQCHDQPGPDATTTTTTSEADRRAGPSSQQQQGISKRGTDEGGCGGGGGSGGGGRGDDSARRDSRECEGGQLQVWEPSHPGGGGDGGAPVDLAYSNGALSRRRATSCCVTEPSGWTNPLGVRKVHPSNILRAALPYHSTSPVPHAEVYDTAQQVVVLQGVATGTGGAGQHKAAAAGAAGPWSTPLAAAVAGAASPVAGDLMRSSQEGVQCAERDGHAYLALQQSLSLRPWAVAPEGHHQQRHHHHHQQQVGVVALSREPGAAPPPTLLHHQGSIGGMSGAVSGAINHVGDGSLLMQPARLVADSARGGGRGEGGPAGLTPYHSASGPHINADGGGTAVLVRDAHNVYHVVAAGPERGGLPRRQATDGWDVVFKPPPSSQLHPDVLLSGQLAQHQHHQQQQQHHHHHHQHQQQQQVAGPLRVLPAGPPDAQQLSSSWVVVGGGGDGAGGGPTSAGGGGGGGAGVDPATPPITYTAASLPLMPGGVEGEQAGSARLVAPPGSREIIRLSAGLPAVQAGAQVLPVHAPADYHHQHHHKQPYHMDPITLTPPTAPATHQLQHQRSIGQASSTKRVPPPPPPPAQPRLFELRQDQHGNTQLVAVDEVEMVQRSGVARVSSDAVQCELQGGDMHCVATEHIISNLAYATALAQTTGSAQPQHVMHSYDDDGKMHHHHYHHQQLQLQQMAGAEHVTLEHIGKLYMVTATGECVPMSSHTGQAGAGAGQQQVTLVGGHEAPVQWSGAATPPVQPYMVHYMGSPGNGGRGNGGRGGVLQYPTTPGA